MRWSDLTSFAREPVKAFMQRVNQKICVWPLIFSLCLQDWWSCLNLKAFFGVKTLLSFPNLGWIFPTFSSRTNISSKPTSLISWISSLAFFPVFWLQSRIAAALKRLHLSFVYLSHTVHLELQGYSTPAPTKRPQLCDSDSRLLYFSIFLLLWICGACSRLILLLSKQKELRSVTQD